MTQTFSQLQSLYGKIKDSTTGFNCFPFRPPNLTPTNNSMRYSNSIYGCCSFSIFLILTYLCIAFIRGKLYNNGHENCVNELAITIQIIMSGIHTKPPRGGTIYQTNPKEVIVNHNNFKAKKNSIPRNSISYQKLSRN